MSDPRNTIVVLHQAPPKTGLWATNPLGMWSFVLMLVGVISSIIPLMGIIAFFVLPASLIVGIIALAKRRTPKWSSILGIIGSLIAMTLNTVMALVYLSAILFAAWGLVVGLTEAITNF